MPTAPFRHVAWHMCSVAGFSTLLANETTVGNFCKTNPTALKYVGGLIGARSTLYLVIAVLMCSGVGSGAVSRRVSGTL